MGNLTWEQSVLSQAEELKPAEQKIFADLQLPKVVGYTEKRSKSQNQTHKQPQKQQILGENTSSGLPLRIQALLVDWEFKTDLTSEAPVAVDGTSEEDEEMQLALAASMEGVKDTNGVTSKDASIINTQEETCSIKKPSYPPLPEEPKGDRNLLCRVGIRLPDGRRLQRNFFRTDCIQLLWSFCYSQLGEDDARPFRLTQAIPGASKCLDYDSKLTFEESGLSNSMVSVTWD
ncbi:unnamed protein product [Ilex paraguariensis]|uniref:UBX domain-containing protein n=1 Tax=Ilex paraguariensis TaxID=185542 RepID=A0ABC8RGD3_9AQUA